PSQSHRGWSRARSRHLVPFSRNTARDPGCRSGRVDRRAQGLTWRVPASVSLSRTYGDRCEFIEFHNSLGIVPTQPASCQAPDTRAFQLFAVRRTSFRPIVGVRLNRDRYQLLKDARLEYPSRCATSVNRRCRLAKWWLTCCTRTRSRSSLNTAPSRSSRRCRVLTLVPSECATFSIDARPMGIRILIDCSTSSLTERSPAGIILPTSSLACDASAKSDIGFRRCMSLPS